MTDYRNGRVMAEIARDEMDEIARQQHLNVRDLERVFGLLVAALCLRIRPESVLLPHHHIQGFLAAIEEVLDHGTYAPDRQSAATEIWEEFLRLLAHSCADPSLALSDWPLPPAEAMNLLTRLLSDLSREASIETLHELYDEFFILGLSRVTPVDRSHLERVAALASTLAARLGDIVEYFPLAGESFVRRPRNKGLAYFVRHSAGHPLSLRLRLRLAIRARHAELVPPDATARRFVVLDHPSQASSPTGVFKSNVAPQTSLKALDELLRERVPFNAALVLVTVADTAGAGYRKQLREHLTSAGLVHAVVDFKTRTPAGSRRTMTAWLVSSEPDPRRECLFVDARSLATNLGLGESPEALEVVGATIEQWLADRVNGSPQMASESGLGERAQRFLTRSFGEGYRDLSQFCKSMSLEDVAKTGSILSAAKQMEHDAEKAEYPSAINHEGMLDLLISQPFSPKCIYLIGDNGAGKSLAMREMAEALAERSIFSIGVAFGFTDRFEQNPKGNLSQWFRYRGARTSEFATTHRGGQKRLSEMVMKVHTNQHLLDAFIEATSLLGFRQAHYLAPTKVSSSKFYQLAKVAADNERIYSKISHEKYKLAMVRDSRPEDVVEFSKLSSGEQQILTLLMNSLADVQGNSVV